MVLEVLPKDTVVITADRHSRLLKGRHLDFVSSGFTVPASESGLTLPVAAGVAFISGYRVEHTATENLTMVDNSTNYIFLLKDGTWHVDQDNTQPADSVAICTAATSGGNITATVDKRSLVIHSANQLSGLVKPIMITMHQVKKDYASQEVYASPISEHGCKTTTWHNYADAITFNNSLLGDLKIGKKYTIMLSANLKGNNFTGEGSYAGLSINGGAEQGVISRIPNTYAWVTSSEIEINYDSTVQCRHKSGGASGNNYINQWKLLLKYDLGYYEITPSNQGFTTLKCIQILLNQNDSARITKMDDTTETYTDSVAACLAAPMENVNLPKDVLPMQLKKIEQLAGSPTVIVYDGG